MAKQNIERSPKNRMGDSAEKEYREIGNVTIPKPKQLFQLRTITV